MTRRLKLMLGALALIAALLVLDRPAPEAIVEVSEAMRRVPDSAATAAAPASAPMTAPALPHMDAPVPDLFAQAAATHYAAAVAQAGVTETAAETEKAPAEQWTLLGFKEEDGVREAYLQYNGDVLTARPGAVLGKRYRVLAVRPDAVDIRDNTSGRTRRIGFKDQQ